MRKSTKLGRFRFVLNADSGDRDSYKDVFEVLVGGSEVLNNITDGLAAAVGL